MTQPQTMSVQYEELMARADELENLLPPPPPGNNGFSGPGAPPCIFVDSIDATKQLSLSADNIRIYLNNGQQQWDILAQSLRDAAKAYEQTDTSAADEISNGDSSPKTEVPDQDPATTTTSSTVPPTSYNSYAVSKTSQTSGNYYDVKDAAYDVGDYNAGVAVDAFATDWANYATPLEATTYAFRPFQYWEGAAAAAFESAFDQQRSWVVQMVPLCTDLAAQASTLVAATRTLYSTHPTYQQVTHAEQKKEQKKYASYQQASEEAIAQYNTDAGLPLRVTQPPAAPSAVGVGGSSGSSELPWDSYPIDGSGIGDGGTGTASDTLPSDGLPSTPTNPAGGLPTGNDTSTATDDAAAMPAAWTGAPVPSTTSGVKPASFGGGGMPSMPLQPAVDAGSPTPAAAARPAGPNGGIRGLGGAMSGRGGMGMAPMAPGAGQGQGQNGKGKRVAQDQQALYTEKRAWTSSVIGNRRRNDAPDNAESKMNTVA